MACETIDEMDIYCELAEIADLEVEEIEKIRLACYCIIDIIRGIDKEHHTEYRGILKNALLLFISIFVDEKKMLEEMTRDVSDSAYNYAMDSLRQLV